MKRVRRESSNSLLQFCAPYGAFAGGTPAVPDNHLNAAYNTVYCLLKNVVRLFRHAAKGNSNYWAGCDTGVRGRDCLAICDGAAQLQRSGNGARVAAGTYQVDQKKFDAALELFRREQFRAARDQWQSADPAQSDPTTQFYIAYSFTGKAGAGFTTIRIFSSRVLRL